MPQKVLADTVRVAINASDYLTRAGLAGCLAEDRRFREVSPERAQEADTVVVAVDIADAATLDLLPTFCDDPGTRFVVVVGKHWRADLPAAVRRGVRAVLWRDSFTPDAFKDAVLTVVAGGASLPPRLQSTLVEHVRSGHQKTRASARPGAHEVSPREVDVLRLIAEGDELSVIAAKLSYSERTVKSILYGMMSRFELRTRCHAVSYAIRSGLI
ncbi:response regulator transcription factor [Streptomyces antibioticus]|uniref:response regulator transcription factor n=1 Tax=Streptomyces antibioticus TaxID=1890 RepID=UPI0036887EFD